MENDFLSKSFTTRGIEVFVPDASARSDVNKIIGGELEYGIVREESQQKLIAEIEKMKAEKGIEGIILGCTELPLALSNENTPVKCLDIMEIHIKKLGELVLDR